MVNIALLKVSSADGYLLWTYDGGVRRYMNYFFGRMMYLLHQLLSSARTILSLYINVLFRNIFSKNKKVEWRELVVTHLTLEAEFSS